MTNHGKMRKNPFLPPSLRGEIGLSRFPGCWLVANEGLFRMGFPIKNVIHPLKLTWNPKMKVWKMFLLFKWVIFRFHVSFPGCNPGGDCYREGATPKSYLFTFQPLLAHPTFPSLSAPQTHVLSSDATQGSITLAVAASIAAAR